MSTVVVERQFEDPVAYGDIQAAEAGAAWCLDAHGVEFQKRYFSRDGRRTVCLYEAPDAESVRRAQETGRLPFVRAWAARVIPHTEPERIESAVIVERAFTEPVGPGDLLNEARERAACMDAWGCRLIASYLSLDGLRCVSVFTALDAESVRDLERSSGLPHERIWPATVHELGS